MTSDEGVAPRRPWAHGAVALGSQRNGLNLVRLVLAYSVLVAHGWPLAGKGEGPALHGETIGGWAVFGFFAISGYLVTGSRLGNSLGDYLSRRIARILPGYLVCLVVTAFVFAPINYGWFYGSADGFLLTKTGPLSYIWSDIALRMNVYDVAQTPLGVPYSGAWDGSLYTLYYEFLCYLIIAALVCFAWFRRRSWAIAVLFAASVALQAKIKTVLPYVGDNVDFGLLTKLLPFFLAGALLRLLRDRIVLSWPMAVVAALGAVALAVAIPDWGGQLGAPLVAYVLLWLGAVLPIPELIRRNDISYGVYIYAFPVQQLCAMTSLEQSSLLLYDLVAAVATLPLAIASWVLIERPAMLRVRGRRAERVALQADQALPAVS